MLQPRVGYRAGVDPVLLAASIAARAGQTVLELGCGAGPVLLCLAARVPGLSITGVELQPGYADLARRNADLNGVAAEIVCADIAALPEPVRQRSYDHLIANPPYFEGGRRTASDDESRELGLAGATPLGLWVEVAARRTAPQGMVSMIVRSERLPELLGAFAACLRSVQVLPLAARLGRDPKLVLVRGRKQGNAPFRLHTPLVLHQGGTHVADRDDYTPEISAVLREAAALTFPQ
jgi:tRNA1(Val) A37 N6-methylase TrmN6